MYSVYDRKTLTYLPPYFSVTDGSAVRMLSGELQDPKSMLSRHPNDYVLFFVGEFNDQDGAVAPAHPLVHIIDCQALVAAMQQEIPFPVTATNGKDQDAMVQAHDLGV